jgi:hypothetical protein
LGGEFLAIGTDPTNVSKLGDLDLLKVNNIKEIHTKTSGGILGSKKAVDLYFKA